MEKEFEALIDADTLKVIKRETLELDQRISQLQLTNEKIASIEAMDEHIVGPILESLEDRGEDWRILYLPDHYTAVGTRKHDPTPVPFAIAGKRIKGVLNKPYCEVNAAASDLHIEFGHELMEYFLFSGLA